MTNRGINRWDAAAPLLLVALTIAVFAQTAGFDFINYDDGAMVYDNPRVLGGLTWENVRWAFSNAVMGIWMPITVLSYQLDSTFFNGWAGGYHLSSVLVHALNAALLFVVLRLMTRSTGRSLFVALVFAVHPMRAESVAWIAERKDVLCAMFWLLALLAYWHYARKPGVLRYLVILVLTALALMSKSMAVTLPFTLLLLDWWPLERVDVSSGWRPAARQACRLLLEKTPLLLLSIVASWLAVQTQAATHAVASLERAPLGLRLANVTVAYLEYLTHFFLPVRLSIFYPYPVHGHATWRVLIAGALLTTVTAAVLALHRRRCLASGWLWFLGTLVPVIGLVQIGAAATANRYMYIPGIGIALMIAWTWPAPASRRAALVTRVLAGVTVVLLMMSTWRETGYFRDTETVFRRAMAVTKDNHVAYQKLGELFAERGRTEEAVQMYRAAQALYPGDAEVNYNLGSVLIQQKAYEEAAFYLAHAVRLAPDHGLAQSNLGVALTQLGRLGEAMEHLAEAIRIDPLRFNARVNYGVALMRAGNLAEAQAQFEKALEIQPGDLIAQANLDQVRAHMNTR